MKTKLSNLNDQACIMKKLACKISIYLSIYLSICSLNALSQTDFMVDYLDQLTYYDSLISERGIDSMQGTGYKQFNRWFNYWAPKLLPDKDYGDYHETMINGALNFNSSASDGGDPTWRLIGPDDIAGSSIARGTGQIHFICRDKHYTLNDSYLASSPTGGLFRTIDGGNNWFNAGTDVGIYKSGVSSVVVDSSKAGVWYITTGNGEAYGANRIWQNSIGVWRTRNYGEEWEYIGLGYYCNTSHDTILIYNMRKAIQVPNNSSNTSLLVATTSGLFLTENALDSNPDWDLLINGDFYDIEKDINNNNIAYASGSNNTGVYKIDINSKICQKILDPDTIVPFTNFPDPYVRRFSIETSQAAPGYLFAIYTQKAYAYSKLLRYDIANNSWFDKGELPRDGIGQAFIGYERNLGWDLYPDTTDNGELYLIACNVKPFRFITNCLDDTDSVVIIDTTLHYSNPHDDCHYIWVDGQDIWAGTDGGIVKGRLNGNNLIDWESKNTGIGVANVEHIDVASNGRFLASGQFDCGSNIYYADNEGDWAYEYRHGGDGYQCIVINDTSFYLSSQNGNIKLVNGNSQTNNAPGTYINCIDSVRCYSNFETYYQKYGQNLYLTGTKNILKKENGGSWAEISDFENETIYPELGCLKSSTWRIDVHDDNIMYATLIGDPMFGYSYNKIAKYTGGTPAWDIIGNQPTNAWIGAIKRNYFDPDGSVYASIHGNFYCVVWEDSVANATWNDITYNLTDFDVQAINSIISNSTGIYIGTDRGVFFKKRKEENWQKFGNMLPNVEVKDIKIQNDRIYAGTYGRGVWYTSALTCYTKSVSETIDFDKTEIVDKTKIRDIIIMPDVNYTIKSKISMGAGCKIVVKRGAKLVIDNGTITKACPELWKGIEVWGTSNQNQDTINQGWVILKNGATIEYAKCGIATVRNNEEGSFSDLTYAGGVIQAENSFFYNNQISVQMFPYPREYADLSVEDNLSYFSGCTFNYDNLYYYFDDSPVAHISLSGVDGVLFESNTFENTAKLNYAQYDKRAIGISSWNSGMDVVKGNDEEVGNVFNGLCYGIKSYSSLFTAKLTTVDSAVFNNNYTGCYFGAESYMSITNCTFNARYNFEIQVGDIYTGMYLDNCSGYQIEENMFYSNYVPAFSYNYKSVGLYINNSGEENNLVYRNNFSNLLYATIAQNQNRSLNGNYGLQYKCNVFTDNYSDIAVTWDDKSVVHGIANSQGSKADTVIAPANNRFSNEGTWSYSDIYNDGEDINYHLPYWAVAHSNFLIPIYSDTAKVHKSYNNNITSWNYNLACPISTKSSETIDEIKSNKDFFSLNTEMYNDSIAILKDGGNTTSLNIDIITSVPPETMDIRDELLEASPYLSDTVMLSAIEKEDVLSNGIITEVLVENPQASKSDKVIEKLANRINPLSNSQLSLILSNDTVFGHLETLISKRDFNNAEKTQLIYKLIRKYLTNINSNTNDSISVALNDVSSINSFYKKAFCSFNNFDTTNTFAILNSIPIDFDLNVSDQDYYNDYVKYFNILLTLNRNKISLCKIDSLTTENLNNLANNSFGIVYLYAENLLKNNNLGSYTEPYVFPDTVVSVNKTLSNHSKYTTEQPNNSGFKIYPNPAKNYISVEYKVDDIVSDINLKIINSNGKTVDIIKLTNKVGICNLDTRKYKSGIYIINLYNDNKLLQSSKFVKF